MNLPSYITEDYKKRIKHDLLNLDQGYTVYEISKFTGNGSLTEEDTENLIDLLLEQEKKIYPLLDLSTQSSIKEIYYNCLTFCVNLGIPMNIKVSNLKEEELVSLMNAYLQNTGSVFYLESLTNLTIDLLLKIASNAKTLLPYEKKVYEANKEHLDLVIQFLLNIPTALLTYTPGFVETYLDEDQKKGEERVEQMLEAFKKFNSTQKDTFFIVDSPLIIYKNIVSCFYNNDFLALLFRINTTKRQNIYFHQQYNGLIYRNNPLILHLSNRYHEYFYFLQSFTTNKNFRNKIIDKT